MADRELVGERTLELDGADGAAVIVRVFVPVPDQDDFRCNFEIEGLAKPVSAYGMGVDALQALELALQQIGVRLYLSDEFKAGRLTFLGHPNLGFPVPYNLLDIVPPKP